MTSARQSFLARVIAAIRPVRVRFVSGLLLLVPLVITLWVLRLLFDLILGLASVYWPLLTQLTLPPAVLHLVSVLFLLLTIYGAGTLTAHVLGRELVRVAERALKHIPVAGAIYTNTRKAVDLFSSGGERFRSVVLIEFPHPGMRAVGFVTGEIADEQGRDCLTVYIPMAPNPTMGFLQIVPRAGVTWTNWSVESGIRMAMSGGLLNPPRVELDPRGGSALPPPPPAPPAQPLAP